MVALYWLLNLRFTYLKKTQIVKKQNHIPRPNHEKIEEQGYEKPTDSSEMSSQP